MCNNLMGYQLDALVQTLDTAMLSSLGVDELYV
jgi:hypothetical protein